MGLCGEGKKKKSGKTIIIPRGFIKPDAETVIEIPMYLDDTNNLIVKAPTDASSCLTVEAYTGAERRRSNQRPIPTPPSPSDSRPAIPSDVPSNYPEAQPCVPPKSQENRACQTALEATPVPAFRPPVVPAPAPAPVSAPTPAPVTPPPDMGGMSCHTHSSHSPLCPICNQGCYPFSPAPPPVQTPSYYSPQPGTIPFKPSEPLCSYYKRPEESRDDCRTCKTQSPYVFINYPKNERSYEPPEPRKRSESALLSRLLDEKIDKVLKPLLLTLAKTYSEDEREISPRDSYSCLNQRYMSVLRSGSRDLFSSSFEMNKRSWWKDDDSDDYEKYPKRPSKSRYKDYDEDSLKRRDDDTVRRRKSNVCTATSGCPRRKTNVNFDDDDDTTSEQPIRPLVTDTLSEKSFDLPRRDREQTDFFRKKSR